MLFTMDYFPMMDGEYYRGTLKFASQYIESHGLDDWLLH